VICSYRPKRRIDINISFDVAKVGDWTATLSSCKAFPYSRRASYLRDVDLRSLLNAPSETTCTALCKREFKDEPSYMGGRYSKKPRNVSLCLGRKIWVLKKKAVAQMFFGKDKLPGIASSPILVL
jgi:hypothetical protein